MFILPHALRDQVPSERVARDPAHDIPNAPEVALPDAPDRDFVDADLRGDGTLAVSFEQQDRDLPIP